MTPRFRADGTFTIVQLTDLHWTTGDEADRRTQALSELVLDEERPDLVVLTGDVIDGSRCPEPAESWSNAVAPIVARGLPWAAVFGNHDDEGSLSRAEQLKVQRAIPGCLTDAAIEGWPGESVFSLAVLSNVGENPAARLYFFDSGSYAPDGMGTYAWVPFRQIAWYRSLPRSHPPVPALAFLHIPLPEYDEVWATRECRGMKFENVCCPKINSGLFTAFVEAGDVMGVFCGHDHVNDFEGELYGIRLCYGRASGYGTYGREGMARGARVIRMHEGERAFETWLRLEDGSVVTEQPIHEPRRRINGKGAIE